MNPDEHRRRRLAIGLALATVTLLDVGVAAGSDGWSLPRLMQTWNRPDGVLIVKHIHAPGCYPWRWEVESPAARLEGPMALVSSAALNLLVLPGLALHFARFGSATTPSAAGTQ